VARTDIKSPEADSLLRPKFVDGILDMELQRYLRLHATSDDFATTVSKARQFVDANELSRTTKKSALRTTSPSVNYQAIIDGVIEALELRDRERMAEVNAVQASGSSATSCNRNKKAPPAKNRRRQATRPPKFLQPCTVNWPHCPVSGSGEWRIEQPGLRIIW